MVDGAQPNYKPCQQRRDGLYCYVHLPDQHSVHDEEDYLNPYTATLVGALWRLGLTWQDHDVAAVASAIGTSVLEKFFGEHADELEESTSAEMPSLVEEDSVGTGFHMDSLDPVEPMVPCSSGECVSSVGVSLSGSSTVYPLNSDPQVVQGDVQTSVAVNRSCVQFWTDQSACFMSDKSLVFCHDDEVRTASAVPVTCPPLLRPRKFLAALSTVEVERQSTYHSAASCAKDETRTFSARSPASIMCSTAPSDSEVEHNTLRCAPDSARSKKRIRFNFEITFWFPESEQICMRRNRLPALHVARNSRAAADEIVSAASHGQVPHVLCLSSCLQFTEDVPRMGLEHVGFRSPFHSASDSEVIPSMRWPKAPPRHVSVPQATDRVCRATSSGLVRMSSFRGGSNADSSALVGSRAEDSTPQHYTSFDLQAGANVYDKRPEWDADACVRRAITASHVPSPVGRRVLHAIPGWPSPQAIVTSGYRYRSHVSCVLIFQSEPHVPVTIEAFPWETPADLIRFAPPHLGLIGVIACGINGYEGQCDQRIPPDTDWIELKVSPLTANEARRCLAAWGRLPAAEHPRFPAAWTQSGFYPRHGFPTDAFPGLVGVYAAPPADDANATEGYETHDPQSSLPDPLEGPFPRSVHADDHAVESSASSSEDYFSSSHSGGLVCNRVDFPRRPRHPPGVSAQRGARPDLPTADAPSNPAAASASATTPALFPVRTHRPVIPAAPEISRRWNRALNDIELQSIAQPDVGTPLTVFDPIIHVRVIIVHEPDSLADPVQVALDRSPHLGPTFHGRILRHRVDGYPAPQIVLFDTAFRTMRTAPIDLQGEQQRICTLAFPQDSSVYELTLKLATACAAPPTLRFQVARRVCPVDVNGLNVPRFEADTLRDADVIEYRNVQLHWAPRFRTSLQDLLQRDISVTPQLLLPLQVRRSFSHPVDTVVVHRPERHFVRVPFESHWRPGQLRAHVLSSVDGLSDGLMKVPLLSPRYQSPCPHVFVLSREELQRYPHWALVDVRRVSSSDDPFFLTALPTRASLGFIMQMIHDRRPDVGPIAGVFLNTSLMDDDWAPSGQMSLLTVVAPGSDLFTNSPAVWFTADLLESNLGYQTAFHRYEEPRRARSTTAASGAFGVPTSTTSATTSLSWEEEMAARRPIHADPVREGPQPRDPRDHIVCVAASAQCPPGAFTFHRSVDLPEIPARILHYVSRHSFVPRLPIVGVSPMVYKTPARISMLVAFVRDEIEHQVFVWIDAMPVKPYPLFQALDGPCTLRDICSHMQLVPTATPFASVNGQIWTGEERTFHFGDVIQLRSRRASLHTLSLDSDRFCLPRAALLHRAVYGPEMGCSGINVRVTPEQAYRRFTRQLLYDHFKRTYTSWARELILLPGSRIVFVGPDLPVIRIPAGVDGQPSRELAQHLVGSRRVVAMRVTLSGAWLFAAVPADSGSVTWVYEANWGLAFVHCDSDSSQLRTHPIMDRSVLVPNIDFGPVGIALHTFDNRDIPVMQRRQLRDDGREELRTDGVSLLQHRVHRVQKCGASTAPISGIPTPCRSNRRPALHMGHDTDKGTPPVSGEQVPNLWTFWGVGGACKTLQLAEQSSFDQVALRLFDGKPCPGARVVPLSPAHAFPQQCLVAVSGADAVAVLLMHKDKPEVCSFPIADAYDALCKYLRVRHCTATYCDVPVENLSREIFDGMVFDCTVDLLAPSRGVHTKAIDSPVPQRAAETTPLCKSDSLDGVRKTDCTTRRHMLSAESCTACRFGVEGDMLSHIFDPFGVQHLYSDWDQVSGLLPCTLQFLRHFPTWDRLSVPNACQIFVDGSWCPRTREAAWAIAVLLRVEQTWCWAGFYSNTVGVTHCADPLQVPCRHAHDAEMYAVVYAMATVVASRLPTLVNFDCTSAAGIAQGRMQPAQLCTLSRTAVALFHLAGRLGIPVAFAHVKSHQGHPLNEFVDAAAKAVVAAPSRVCMPDSTNLAAAVSSGDLFWLWLTIPRGQELPVLQPSGEMFDDTLPLRAGDGPALSPLAFAPQQHIDEPPACQ